MEALEATEEATEVVMEVVMEDTEVVMEAVDTREVDGADKQPRTELENEP